MKQAFSNIVRKSEVVISRVFLVLPFEMESTSTGSSTSGGCMFEIVEINNVIVARTWEKDLTEDMSFVNFF